MFRKRADWFGSDVLKDPDFFQKPLRSTRTFRHAVIETPTIVIFGLMIIFSFWSILPWLALYMIALALLCVLGTFVAIIKDHRKLSETAAQVPPDDPRNDALRVAAAQAHYGPSMTRTVAFILILALFMTLAKFDTSSWLYHLRIRLFGMH